MNTALRAMTNLGPRLRPRLSKTALGAVLLAVLVVLSSAVYYKEQIATFTSGLFGHDTISAEFAENNQLVTYRHGGDVKIAGVRVGTVTDIEETERGTARVTMQLDDGVRERLGVIPSARIYPTLVLGGRYFIALQPGGEGTFTDDLIPLDRTSLPVELGDVLTAFTPPAKKGMRTAISQMDGVLREGGSDALRDLMRGAPGTLEPAADVLRAFGGRHPDDLTTLVHGMHAMGAAFTRRDTQVDELIAAVEGGTAALAAGSRPWADSLAAMPETMRVTRAGLADLQPTLEQLATTSRTFQPAARKLEPMLAALDPALAQTRLLLRDMRPVLRDAQPVVERMMPVTRESTEVFDDLSGPALDRLNGPITNAVLSPWKGTGPYQGGGASGNKLYEEAGYLASRAAQVFGWYDGTGAFGRLSVGVGLNTVGATGAHMSLEQYLEALGLQQPPGPQGYAPKSRSNSKSPLKAERGAPR